MRANGFSMINSGLFGAKLQRNRWVKYHMRLYIRHVFFIRILFSRPSLNILIFLPISLGCISQYSCACLSICIVLSLWSLDRVHKLHQLKLQCVNDQLHEKRAICYNLTIYSLAMLQKRNLLFLVFVFPWIGCHRV